MQNFKPGTDVPLTFNLTNESGEVLTPTALRWQVLDEAEAVLQAWTTIATLPTTSAVTVTVPSLLTALTPPALRALRTIELEVTTASGVVLLSDAVMIQGATALGFGINTFQTYAQSILLSEDIVSDQIAGWDGSSREVREKALIEAYSRIMLVNVRTSVIDEQSYMAEFRLSYGALRDMTPAQILAIDPRLLEALRKAQVIEAAEILNGDPVATARNSGLLSMTVGESSQFFRSAKPLDLPLCPKAMAVLQRWVRFSAKIGRA